MNSYWQDILKLNQRHKTRYPPTDNSSIDRQKDCWRQFEVEKSSLSWRKLQHSSHPSGQSFHVIKNFQAVPSFQEDDVDYTSRNWLLTLID